MPDPRPDGKSLRELLHSADTGKRIPTSFVGKNHVLSSATVFVLKAAATWTRLVAADLLS